MTLTEFLLARIAEDKATAQNMRAWRECLAKRAAIDAAWADHERIEGEWGSCQSRETMSAKGDNPAVVEHLAAIYADHPDYRDEWRP